ncbi:MAG: competence protein CoiA family protein [Chlamydiales bacterium]
MQNSSHIIQKTIEKRLAPEEVWLKRYFSEIDRTADVVWPAQNLIFQIQSTPISVKEIKRQIDDYEKIGYTIVWILHASYYNFYYLTSVESFLRSYTHYFTNINSLGEGDIYDQHALVTWRQRLIRTPRYPINLSKISYFARMPSYLTKERRKWKYSFQGDLFHQESHANPLSFSKIYRFLFEWLLQKVCD